MKKDTLWVTKIKDFDALEIHPCAVIGRDNKGTEIVAPCEPEQASFWRVYGHYRTGGLETLDDFNTKAEAQKYHDRLIEVYLHLAGERAKTRQQLRKEYTL